MKASIIIPVWNGRKYLPDCLDAVLAQDHPDFEVIAVDNASTDGSADFIAEHYPQVRLIRNENNLGFAGGCNVGLQAARGNVLVLLNQDAVVKLDWLSALIRAFKEHDDVGVVGGKILMPDGYTLSHAGGYVTRPLAIGRHVGIGEVEQGQYDTGLDVEYVTGASLAIRRKVLGKVGLLDERFYPAFYEDVDLCWRVRKAGWRVRYEPRAVAVHDEASSTRHHWVSRHYYHYRNRLLFLFKHFPPAQILREFIPAEKNRILHLPFDELRAGHVALTEIMSMWSLIEGDLSAIKTSDADQSRLLEGLRALHSLIVEQLGGDPALRTPKAYGDNKGIDEPSPVENDAWTNELIQLWEIRERPFTSQVPILGPWISAFRELWNSVATKWYVHPMLTQQVQFNGAVVRALNRLYAQGRNLQAQYQDLHANYWDSDSLIVLLAERCGRMIARISDLEEQVNQIKAQLANGKERRHE